MVMMGKQKIVNGNTVLVPQYEPSSPAEKERYEKLKKAKRESLGHRRYKRNKRKAKTLLNITLAFVIGISFVWRYSVMYNTQKNLNDTKTQINNLSIENENIKVNLLKNSNVGMVEATAISKLKMVYPEKNHVVKCNLEKQNFEKQVPSKNSSSKSEGFIAKIKSMFF